MENLAWPIALLTAFGSAVPQPTEWQRVRDQIKAALVAARSHFVSVHRLQRRKLAFQSQGHYGCWSNGRAHRAAASGGTDHSATEKTDTGQRRAHAGASGLGFQPGLAKNRPLQPELGRSVETKMVGRTDRANCSFGQIRTQGLRYSARSVQSTH